MGREATQETDEGKYPVALIWSLNLTPGLVLFPPNTFISLQILLYSLHLIALSSLL